MKFLEALEHYLKEALNAVADSTQDDEPLGRWNAYSEVLRLVQSMKLIGDKQTETRFRNMEDIDVRLPTS